MIEVTCGACGAVQQLADADVPPGGKQLTCSSCKSRINVPGAKATISGAPRPGALGGAALPDLPAPRRPSPLASAGPAKPLPKSPLDGAEDLPAPKLAGRVPTTGVGPTTGGSVTRGGIEPLRDAAGSGPMRAQVAGQPGDPRSMTRGGAEDLPAPKRSALPPLPPMAPPAPRPETSPLAAAGADLVAPKRSAGPAISAKPTVPAVPPMMPRGNAGPAAPTPAPGEIDLDDLLAPAKPGLGDLPAPARPGLTDLPAPKRDGAPDLPAPKRPVQPDLPAPKRPPEIADLPQPKGATDLPAPKGFFDDLPQPAKNQPGSTDLPAPKGFFDDLPQPAKAGKPELPAPKGFFDDIPQPARQQTAVPAPVGAQPSKPPTIAPSTRPAAPPPIATHAGPPPVARAVPGGDPRAHNPSAPPPTADDLFNDLTPPPVLTTPPALDLDDLDLGPGGDAAAPADGAGQKSPSASGIRRTAGASQSGAARTKAPSTPPAPTPTGTRSTEDSDVDGKALPMLDLGDGGAADFGNVDLPSTPPPAAAGTGAPTGVSFKAGKGTQAGGSSASINLHATGETDLALDVEPSKEPAKRAKRASIKASKKDKAKSKSRDKAPTSKATRIVLLVVLLLAAAAAGGWYLWQRHQKAVARAAELDGMLRDARAAMLAGNAGHWRAAQTKAQGVFDASSKNAEAAGIAASAAYASVFDDGQNAEAQAKLGASIVTRALGNGLGGPDLDKAQGLKLIVDGQAKRALDTYLDPVVKRAPADGNAALFQGWGRTAVGDYAGAIDAFDRSAKLLPKRDLPALLGRARAKLAMGDVAGARADFTAVLAKDKTHVGAQVGLAASASTPAEISQREKDLVALLQTKDIDKADARAVAQAYTIAGDDAARSNRLDTARERYRKAMQKAPLETAPLRGLAQLELRDGKLDAAQDALDKGLKLAPDNVDLLVVSGQLALARGKPADAEAVLAKLRDLKPTAPAEKVRVLLFSGALFAAQTKQDDALDAYLDAIKLADPYDVEPPLAAARLLGQMADANAAKASDLRARAADLLAPLEAKAGSEPTIAIALGIGYLAAGDPSKAEKWLRSAIAAKPDDIDAHFQLAEALSRQGKRDEALAILKKAFDFDPTRIDVGVQLARRFEEAGRPDDAAAMYDKLLGGKDISLDLRARAGKFYARNDKIEKARLQGEEILKVDEDHPAGLYLRGLGLLKDGKLEDARRSLHAATEEDKDPEYLDAYGQACEELVKKTADGRYRDEALRVYEEAAKLDPNMLNPEAGMGRLYIATNQPSKALAPLTKALALSPNDPDIQYNLGLVYYQTQPDQAIELMTKSLATKPRSDGFRNLGMLYDDLEKFKQAEAALSRATELGQGEENAGATVTWLTEAYYTLGRNAVELRHYPVARKAWQAYLDRNPTDTTKVDKVRREMLSFPR